MLGNNKVPIITKTIEDMKIKAYDEGFVNPSDDENCVWNEKESKENTNIDNTESKNIKVDEYESTLKLRDISTVAYDYKSLLMFYPKEDTCKMKSNTHVDHNKNVVLSKDGKVTGKKQKSNNIRNQESFDSYKDGDDDWGQSYASPGFQNTFSLDVTVEDIEKGILMTEKLLEEYNFNRLALNKKSQ
ncbi:unnamed protein product [Arctia plantaginis]|uniref:Uncharacterized protein n=1 Tax=Arctia plantaginis TaxID=874455 RepID=A0A8S1BBB7_ARCPL|nr:unnamed protein product [Arctia plantaginis]